MIFHKYVLLAALVSANAWSDSPTTALPPRNIDLRDVAYNNQNVPTMKYQVKLITRCFGVNLRHAGAELRPGSEVRFWLKFEKKDDRTKRGFVEIPFPAQLTAGNAGQGESTLVYDTFEGEPKAKYVGHTLQFNIKLVKEPDPAKQYEIAEFEAMQKITPADPGSPLTFQVEGVAYKPDGSGVQASVAFPGAAGFCGSYYSPLMVFFGDKKPSIKNISSFPLRPEGDKFYWPEGSNDWAFLVYDKAGNGKITEVEQLFGSVHHKNGFETLRQLDSNKDGKIDVQDKEFAKIKLWYDLDGNGISEKDEVKALSHAKLDSISLDYKDDRIIPVGERGEFREYGQAFSGKKSFEVIDVWFGVHTFKSMQPAKKGSPRAGKKKT